MEQQVIIFLYNGQHPSKEAIRKIAETLVNNVVCDPNSLNNINLDETGLGKVIASFAIQEQNATNTSVDIDPMIEIYTGMADMLKEMMTRLAITIEEIPIYMSRRYIAALRYDNDIAFVTAVNAIYKSGTQITFLKTIKNQLRIPLKDAVAIWREIHKIVDLCQGLTKE